MAAARGSNRILPFHLPKPFTGASANCRAESPKTRKNSSYEALKKDLTLDTIPSSRILGMGSPACRLRN